MDQQRNPNGASFIGQGSQPSLSVGIGIQALGESLKTFNSYLEGSPLPFDKIVLVAKTVIPELQSYYESLIKETLRK